MKHRPIQRFMLGVLVFLPISFALWYLAALVHLAPLTWVTEQLLQWTFPQAVLWLKLDGSTLVLASNFSTNPSGVIVSPPVSDDLMGFHLNPLIYTYSLPLLMALILATPATNKWQQLGWGGLLWLPIAGFSMFFSVLKVLSFDVGLAFQQQQALSPWMLEMIALAYQMGTLILPMIAPLVIWMALNRKFLLTLAPQLQRILAY
ncbi:exosortase H-associated membrane protein [Thiothrix eikelboomii]|uniref:Uncharacterized protein n=1 Tax=Thiothrix eikelboomii TaxID=92487 RepID=A0A1T4XJ91_9GAMM|nr:exosortase H-associated membrane protein [Thiothrix eikelboomii]SKA89165.1 hypothetical protein SAMN02745130_03009 [Thiothrix eikelboomii]